MLSILASSAVQLVIIWMASVLGAAAVLVAAALLRERRVLIDASKENSSPSFVGTHHRAA